MEIMEIVRLVLSTYILFPFHFLFWGVVVLVYFQYRRVARIETQLFGRPRHNVMTQTLVSTVIGLAGGLLASALLVFFGISLLEIGIIFVWPVAILLLLIHPRYLCFAYAGGIVGAFAVLVNLLGEIWPALTEGFLAPVAGIHIPGLLALIGILHLTESFLIAVSGHYFPSPQYVKTDRGVVGGFSLQKFWPLPLVGLIALTVPQAAANAAVAAQMPDWWPLLPSATAPEMGKVLMYQLLPIVAGLGYGDLAISLTPREKSRRSAVNLGLYSLILMVAAFLAFHLPSVMIFAALFSPLGHEFLITAGNKKEFGSRPIYQAPAAGVKVMDLFPDAPAAAAGLRPLDVITAINGLWVNDSITFANLFRMSGTDIELEIKRDSEFLSIRFVQKGDPGIILVPDRYTRTVMEVKHTHFFTALSEKIRKIKARV
ncbi:MAG: PDZ domain-containing protein [Bacillota bacterium]|nr:PDZ domain-containing protein [Bacillota bacterium]MDW7682932.1 PDZ domain-containing protein [Bacillota bacterium]